MNEKPLNLSRIKLTVIDFEIPMTKGKSLSTFEALNAKSLIQKIETLGAENINIKESISIYSKSEERLTVIKEILVQMLTKWKELYTVEKLLGLVKSKILEERSFEKEMYLEQSMFSKYISKNDDYFDTWEPKKDVNPLLANTIVDSFEVNDLIENIDDWMWSNAINEFWWNP